MNIIKLTSSNLEPKEITPKFFIVEGSIKKGDRISKLMLYVGVHYTLEEAHKGLIIEMQNKAPDLWKYAIENGGVSFHQHKSFSPERLNDEFKKYERNLDILAKKSEKSEEDKRKENLNKLMQALIGKGDLHAVDKYADVLEVHHREFVKDAIKKNNHA